MLEAQRSQRDYDETSPQSAELFHLIVENIKDYAIFMTDAAGVVVSWNPGVERLLGYAEGEIVGQSVAIIFTPEDQTANVHRQEMETALQTGRAEDKRWHVRKDNSRFWANGMVMPVRANDGSLRGFAKVMRDDTARKLAEDNLEQVLAGITDSFYRLDADFRYTYVNRATCAMFDLTEADFLGKTLWQVFPETDGSRFHAEVRRAFERQEAVVFENFYPPLGRWFENRVYPSPDGVSIITAEITARKRAAAVEMNFRQLFESAPGKYVVLEPDNYRIVAASDAYLQATMRRREDVMNKNVFEAFPNDPQRFDADGVRNLRASLDRVKREKITDAMAVQYYAIQTPSGEFEERWWSPINSPVFGAAGELAFIIHRVEDVTAFVRQKQAAGDEAAAFTELETRAQQTEADIVLRGQELQRANEALRESEARLQKAVSIETVGVLFFRLDGRVSNANRAALRMFGYTREELLAVTNWEVLTDAEFLGITAQSADNLARHGETAPYEKRMVRKDGSVWWGLFAPTRIGGEGSASECVEFIIDITEAKRAEAALRESETQLRALADTISQLAWMAHPDGSIFWYNRKWYEYTGATPEEMAGWGWQSVHDPELLPAIVERWRHSLDTGETFETEFPLKSADNTYRWFLTRANPLRDSNNNIKLWFGTNTDIEEVRQARLQAEEANRLKDEFLATVSHELRTPLNAILGWSQMLQNRRLDEPDARKALATIERNARAQNQLIEDILDTSRIITGKLRLDVRDVDLSNVVAAAIDAVRPAAAAKNIKLQTLIDASVGLISGDPDRLQQVVWNLLSNAIKFTDENGRVQARLEKVGSSVEITISDTGRGIEPEFLPHVFDRFRQSDGSMTRRHGGLGLGLAIVRQLVELHGGNVSVDSAGVGNGATFTVSLPVLPVKREAASGASRAHSTAAVNASADCAAELAAVRVLLVDDEQDSRELLKLVLDSCGARVTTASSAAEALELIQSEQFDVVVSDIGMPEENGFSLMRKIRNLPHERGGAVPAIALTAYARPEDRVQALRSGFQLHIAKPVEPNELIAATANLAGRPAKPESR